MTRDDEIAWLMNLYVVTTLETGNKELGIKEVYSRYKKSIEYDESIYQDFLKMTDDFPIPRK